MLSEAVQDYLKAIYKLSRAPETGQMVSTTLIAERMGVSPASATNMIKRLAEMNILQHRPYQGVELTPSGPWKSCAITGCWNSICGRRWDMIGTL